MSKFGHHPQDDVVEAALQSAQAQERVDAAADAARVQDAQERLISALTAAHQIRSSDQT